MAAHVKEELDQSLERHAHHRRREDDRLELRRRPRGRARPRRWQRGELELERARRQFLLSGRASRSWCDAPSLPPTWTGRDGSLLLRGQARRSWRESPPLPLCHLERVGHAPAVLDDRGKPVERDDARPRRQPRREHDVRDRQIPGRTREEKGGEGGEHETASETAGTRCAPLQSEVGRARARRERRGERPALAKSTRSSPNTQFGGRRGRGPPPRCRKNERLATKHRSRKKNIKKRRKKKREKKHFYSEERAATTATTTVALTWSRRSAAAGSCGA